MIAVREGTLFIEGPVTQATAGELLYAGMGQLAEAGFRLDLSAVTAVDSCALALLIAWLRCAEASARRLVILNLPAPLVSLAGLYGVDGFLTETASSADDDLTHVLDRH